MKITQCMRCKYKLPDMKCKAFPKGIPTSLYLGQINHNHELEGQIGSFIYEPTDSHSKLDLGFKNKQKSKFLANKDKYRKVMVNYFFNKVDNDNLWEKAIFSIKWINERRFEYPPIKVYYEDEEVVINEIHFRSFMRRKANYLRHDKNCSYSNIKLTIFPDGNHQFEFEKAKGTSREEIMEKYRMELKEINENAKKDDNIKPI